MVYIRNGHSASSGVYVRKTRKLCIGIYYSGENTDTAAVREVKEELGPDLESVHYAGSYWLSKKELLMIGFIGFTNNPALLYQRKLIQLDGFLPWTLLRRCSPTVERNAPDLQTFSENRGLTE